MKVIVIIKSIYLYKSVKTRMAGAEQININVTDGTGGESHHPFRIQSIACLRGKCTTTECKACGGTGVFQQYKCRLCSGKGQFGCRARYHVKEENIPCGHALNAFFFGGKGCIHQIDGKCVRIHKFSMYDLMVAQVAIGELRKAIIAVDHQDYTSITSVVCTRSVCEPMKCKICNGTGKFNTEPEVDCRACKGTGKFTCKAQLHLTDKKLVCGHVISGHMFRNTGCKIGAMGICSRSHELTEHDYFIIQVIMAEYMKINKQY